VQSENQKTLISSREVYTNATERTNVMLPHPAFPLRGLKQQWVAKLPAGVFGSAVVSGNSLFVGCDDGYVYELSQADGKILRKFFIGTEVTPEPLIWNGYLFAGEGTHLTHDARIYSFDLKTGAYRGSFQTKGHTEGAPVIGTYSGITSLFVMAGADGVYAIDPETLKSRWHKKLGHTDSEVRVVDGKVFFATGTEKGNYDRSHRAFALDFLTGEVVWQDDLSASGWMPPVVTDKDVCFGTGEIYMESHFGQFACYDMKTGAKRLSINMDEPLMGIPLKVGSTIALSDLQGDFCAIQWPDGWRRWCRKGGITKTFASPTYDGNGHFIYPTAKNGLDVYDMDNGSLVLNWKPTGAEGEWKRSFSRVSVARTAAGLAWFLPDMSGNLRKWVPEYRR
jgi:hypothetical protein